MGTENKQLNRKKVVGLVLCVVLVIILAGFVQTLLASASSTDKTMLTPTPGKLSSAALTATAGTTPTASTKARIATATVNPNATPTPASKVMPTVAPAAPMTGGGSTMLLGTNLNIQDSSDQVLTSSATRTALQKMHVGLFRIPTRDGQSDSIVTQAAQITKSMGAAPLVILQGDKATSDALDNDTRIIKIMNSIFGSGVVYYEYGNEQDFFYKLQPKDYTDSWNRLIPQLKKLALNGRFIGPVNYQYNGSYLQYFLQNAQPRPDAVSWHEYTCASDWTNDICMSHLDNWTVHFNNARGIMNSTIGTSLPIMITEWNYTANPISGDGKSDNDTFMSAWTTKALQTFAANGIFAAAQYSCTEYAAPLVDSDGTMTAQGLAFQKYGGG
ncbi:hypothetical protein [Reticulibacter mediterranei]|nr:hypothetical protein [Reticulibacter mediterranei]